MSSQPRDKYAYRLAVGVIGVAFVVVLAGLCVIVAIGGREIPTELWTITTALGGGLLGILAPSPQPPPDVAKKTSESMPEKFQRIAVIGLKEIWSNRTVVILLAIFGVSVGFGISHDSTQLQALAGASGAALVGLLAPAPGEDKQP